MFIISIKCPGWDEKKTRFVQQKDDGYYPVRKRIATRYKTSEAAANVLYDVCAEMTRKRKPVLIGTVKQVAK